MIDPIEAPCGWCGATDCAVKDEASNADWTDLVRCRNGTLRRAERAEQACRDMVDMESWVSADSPPPDYTSVLCDEDGTSRVIVGYVIGGKWYRAGGRRAYGVRRWRHMPAKPKEQS